MLTFMNLLRQYMPLITASLVLGAAAYFIVLALLRRRGRRLSLAWKLWLFISSIYVFSLVLVLVLRTNAYNAVAAYRSLSLELFYGYRVLLRNFNAHGFINELMNILIFVPFGFLFTLPFGERKSRWLVIPLGFLTSLAVEALQYLLASGIADVDDLFNNTLGAACGFALARFCMNARGRRVPRSAVSLLLALVCLSPPLAVWAAWVGSPYGESEYDRRPGTPVTGEISFSDEAAAFLDGLGASDTGIYAATGGDLASARECADAFFALHGTSRGDEDLYDDDAWFRDEGFDFLVKYEYAGPIVEYTDFRHYRSDSEADTGLGEPQVRALLSDWGLSVPEGARFEPLVSGYRFSLAPADGLGGEVYVTVSDGAVGYVLWSVCPLERIGTAETVSAAGCARRLASGDYSWWSDGIGADLRIEEAQLVYTLDSKGTYRPYLMLSGGGSFVYMALGME